MVEKRSFGPFRHHAPSGFARADLEIFGINTFRPSYTAHVFFNDPELECEAEFRERESYAGRFSVFGHAQCAGDDGHCHVPEGTRRFDHRPTSPLTRAFRRIVVTDILRKVIPSSDEVTITILAASLADPEEVDGDHLLDLQGLQITTFR